MGIRCGDGGGRIIIHGDPSFSTIEIIVYVALCMAVPEFIMWRARRLEARR